MEINGGREDIEWEQFPDVEFTNEQLIEMARNVNVRKAMGNDGIHPRIFDIARHRPCKWRGVTEWCENCRRKLMAVEIFVRREYWES